VLDQAGAMATLAAGGERAATHFVSRVERDQVSYYDEPDEPVRVLDEDIVADITAVLAEHAPGILPDGTPSATISGTALMVGSAFDAAHAWQIGFTPWLAVAVWIGNEEVEFPLRDAVGNRITGETLPAELYRAIVAGAAGVVDPEEVAFPAEVGVGDPLAGDAPVSPLAP
jgi:membrane peptidoglycan carboxypeptidase